MAINKKIVGLSIAGAMAAAALSHAGDETPFQVEECHATADSALSANRTARGPAVDINEIESTRANCVKAATAQGFQLKFFAK